MTIDDYASFFSRLNDLCAGALASAANLCEVHKNREIRVEHWLITLIERDDGDIRAIMGQYGLDHDAIRDELLKAIERLPRGLRGRPRLSPQLDAWLNEAWMRALDDAKGDEPSIRSVHLLAALVDHPQWLRAWEVWTRLTISVEQIKRVMPGLLAAEEGAAMGNASQVLADSGAAHSDPSGGSRSAGLDKQKTSHAGTTAAWKVLERFTRDITMQARGGKLDPIFGRDAEIRQVVDILLRRRKNNPLLVGDPGVGKTALVEGLALRIAEGDVPETLRGMRVLELDLGLLQAGANVKGEFEERVTRFVEAIRQSPTPILLFIDEAHTLIGAGNSAGGTDAANLLKPALARGELRTIAATTWAEYKQYFERDAALERRFQLVKVEEPDDEMACRMLRGLKGRYMEHHGVHITDAAVQAAVKWSRRYLSGRQLPDKAVDLLDTAAARVRLSMDTTPAALAACRAERSALEIERQALDQDLSATVEYPLERIAAIEQRLRLLEAEQKELNYRHADQQRLVMQLLALREQLSLASSDKARWAIESSIKELHGSLVASGAELLMRTEVDQGAVASVIADWTGVPVDTLLKDEVTTLLNLEARLGRAVLGQDEALAALAKGLRVAKAGLTFDQAPLGVFLLVGPSGVGKTETARALAEALFGGERALITFNLAEYQEAHTVSQLKGSPPGYVGYGQGGVLTEAVRQRPYSILLLDEVEKGHRDVLNLFYDAFDRGFMRDGEGRLVDFRHTVIVMTSNLGSDEILAATERVRQGGGEATMDLLLDAARPRLVDHFQQALLARFQTIVYRPLSERALASIVRMKLDNVAKRIRQRFNASLACEESLLQAVVQACQPSDSGARSVDHLLDQQILPALSQELLTRSVGVRKVEDIRLGYSQEEGVLIDINATVEGNA